MNLGFLKTHLSIELVGVTLFETSPVLDSSAAILVMGCMGAVSNTGVDGLAVSLLADVGDIIFDVPRSVGAVVSDFSTTILLCSVVVVNIELLLPLLRGTENGRGTSLQTKEHYIRS